MEVTVARIGPVQVEKTSLSDLDRAALAEIAFETFADGMGRTAGDGSPLPIPKFLELEPKQQAAWASVVAKVIESI